MNNLQMVLAVSLSFATTCHPFNTNHNQSVTARNGISENAFLSPRPLPPSPMSCCRRSIIQHRVTPNNGSRLYLFDAMLKNQDRKRIERQSRSPNGSSLHGIPDEDLHFLRSGFGMGAGEAQPPFPYSIDLSPSADSKKSTRLVIRFMEDEDITKVMPEVVREFGALALPPSATPEPGDELATKVENYLFSLTVLIGLTQRVVRREKGYSSTNSARPDHNVICLCEQIPNDADNGETEQSFSEKIVAIAELSWQPPNPNGNAPPFVLPYFMKTLISRFGPSRDETSSKEPKGYVSNVLVWKTRRGRGYSRVLMAALEGIARTWGCDDVRLHVDANEYSGRIARGLYWNLGYEGVPDRGISKENNLGYDWMGPSMANQGLYLVDGVPLLYLRKKLGDE